MINATLLAKFELTTTSTGVAPDFMVTTAVLGNGHALLENITRRPDPLSETRDYGAGTAIGNGMLRLRTCWRLTPESIW